MSNDKVAATFHGSDKSDEAEVERLTATLDRVRALAEEWQNYPSWAEVDPDNLARELLEVIEGKK